MSLEDIKARAEAATEGPWDCDGFSDSALVNLSLYEGTNQGRVIASDITRNEDADFLLSARTDIPKLVAALEAIEFHIVELQESASGEHQEIGNTLEDIITAALS